MLHLVSLILEIRKSFHLAKNVFFAF